MSEEKIRKRTFTQKSAVMHQYFKRTGFYRFLLKNVINLVLFLGGIVALIFVLDYLVDIKFFIQNWLFHFHAGVVLAVFLFFQSVLGLIPTDLFTAWSNQFEYPFVMVGILALISYIGGINAYFIGKWVRHFPKIDAYISKRNEKYMNLIKKWGGAVIILSAVFPLPYATTCTTAGMLKYPFKLFILFGLTRFIRFFAYAIPIFNAMDKIIG